MIDYIASLQSAKRLEDEYRAGRQHVGLATLENIQKGVARALFQTILESVRAESEQVGGFLAEALASEISSSLACPRIQRHNDSSSE